MSVEPGHRTALLDWLACAVGGRDEPATRAARSLGDGLTDRIALAGTAGHVLDYDDTYLMNALGDALTERSGATLAEKSCSRNALALLRRYWRGGP